MYSVNLLKQVIKGLIDKGIHKIVIYPFGENGYRLKNIMEEYFGIQPYRIVDNLYCKYNENIISELELERIADDSVYVVICAENTKHNREIHMSLSRYMKKDNIINLNSLRNDDFSSVDPWGGSFAIENIVPGIHRYKKSHVSDGKIKVRILYPSYDTWNMLESVCRAFEGDERFDVLVIIILQEGVEETKKQLLERGHTFINEPSYDVQSDRPDIIIASHPRISASPRMKSWRRYTKMVAVASGALIRYGGYTIDSFLSFINKGYGYLHPDYYLFDSLLYGELKDVPYFSGKIVEMGNAKYDAIYNACQKKQYIRGWEKLKDKKVFLYAVDHRVDDKEINRELSFDLYAPTIFQYAQSNPDIGIIFRPHGMFIKELLGYGYWTQDDMEQFKKWCEDSPNIVYDNTDTYEYAFSVADAVMTDGFCGIICSALPTLKPIGVLYRYDMEIHPLHPEVTDNYHCIYSQEQLVDFMDMVKSGQDDKYQLRKAASEKYVMHFDGENGRRIKDFIVDKFMEKFGYV